MRYPNIRYGHKGELEFWMQGHSVKDVAKRLKRSERSVHDWLHGKRKVPWWVPEILRLQHYEYQDRLRQMGFTSPKTKLAIATADVLKFPTPASPVSAPITPLQKPIESNQTSVR
ncbi:helix-turn-helix domain-containing protein [Herbaspirillum huttiense F1]|uniref:helix-turn-helix domain-containing protein n=1 Tax=Herbaspirillum huttiense TaxID=863372 RepID=UPI00288487A0|nr:helix-turn-helix domain-containing protein [Herbaspirillum huttiense]MDT0358135.1 helix-turn-helix domain-containing protein [Herbaspirillum huttiense F1]